MRTLQDCKQQKNIPYPSNGLSPWIVQFSDNGSYGIRFYKTVYAKAGQIDNLGAYGFCTLIEPFYK